MKIVTMCRGGNVRSVAAKLVLRHYFGAEVIAIGFDNTSPATKDFLFNWADIIFVLSPNFMRCSDNAAVLKKTYLLDVGNDVWANPFHEDLIKKLINLINESDWLFFGNDPIKADSLLLKIKEYKEKIYQRNVADLAV